MDIFSIRFTCEECLDICHQTKNLASLHRVINKKLPACAEHICLLLKLKLFILLNFRLICCKHFLMAKMFNEVKFVEHNFKLIIFDQTSSLFHECLDIG